MTTRRTFLAAAVAAPALATAAPAAARTSPTAVAAVVPTHGGRRRLTNLDHLRFLLDEVPLAATATHTTYRIDREPTALAPWTYADAASDGTFRRVGGGTLDPATGYYSQGAFNADDISRSAVVFLRDWHASGDPRSRKDAYQTLRALTYLQDATGPNAGRVVLWQQADGTLNPSAIPVELPDPSDSAESYWLARTVWALGEGYAAFRTADPAFAAFLLARLHLALGALERGSLSRYGRWVVSDGVRLPDWLIVGGADATSEALLGLVAAAKALPRDRRIARALDRYAAGVAAMGATGTDGRRGWPFGAILPWTGSLGFWHAWGGAAPEALAAAAALRRRPDWEARALADAGTFTPLVLATGGPNNAWTPAPGEAQIAYGAHGRLAGILGAWRAGGGPGLRVLAGLAGGWFFGANTAGVPVYDPATGVTFDGVETDGRINHNSGAESTIHGQLAMLLLDRYPDVGALASSITRYVSFSGVAVLDAESARMSPGCTVVRPSTGAWTGEGNLVGGGYVHVPAGEWVEFDVETSTGAWALPVVWRTAVEAGQARWDVVGGRTLGRTVNGGTGPAGLTEAEGSLVPQLLDHPLRDGRVTVRCTSEGDLRLDGLMLRPLVATARYGTSRGDVVLYAGSATRTTFVAALVPGSGEAYDAEGDPRGRDRGGRVRVVAGGFTVTR